MPYNFSDFHASAQKALEHVQRDIGSLRTGRASSQMLDNVHVEAYGTTMQLVEVASIQAPDPSLLIVSPWDKSLLSAVEKGIQAAGINLNPVVDGDIVRIAVPSLTEETRKEMVKQLHKKVESGRVMLRSVRAETKKDIDDQEGSEGVSEDDVTAQLKKLDEELKKYMDRLEQLLAAKEKELLTV
ncbi:ribosome recycling factor [Candidatus Woesebacteria bacterium]|nr:ribosome recycling factor [Candidatus Woesebacteria bacterium]